MCFLGYFDSEIFCLDNKTTNFQDDLTDVLTKNTEYALTCDIAVIVRSSDFVLKFPIFFGGIS